ncbi:cobalamin biosynthesis protein CbiL [Ancylobacter polymorphus]|uniref:Cobalamin biosynthesis protein CbiL n=1 Tax=Ancylobacter polymorphus TaxID=223390 RepID=A0A9E6ZSI6_9HYPH|nr:cobalamin biosynthesis protein CbiL [Ancylobacter polymorphus]UOK70904.1 cobalamin biosynthesis protein CbiL [Ancylobacter polymorphus]
MIRLLLPLLLALAFAGPAQAHKLKVFATVEGAEVTGYAFFIGGGRAAGAVWTAKDPAGTALDSGTTDGEGRFAFPVPQPPVDATVTVDTREGHVAAATLPASRFGGAAALLPPLADGAAPAVEAPGDARLAALVEAAVQRQVTPLMERIEQMDDRLRLADVMSGIFLILGLAGMALWAKGRRT